MTEPVSSAGTTTHTSARPVVLIANAHEWTARALAMLFPARRFDVRRVETGPLALAAARELRPLAVILDYDIPQLECTAVCRALIGDPTFALSTPIVITSETNPGQPQKLAALRAGAWDFCVQPLNADAFYRKVMALAGLAWDDPAGPP